MERDIDSVEFKAGKVEDVERFIASQLKVLSGQQRLQIIRSNSGEYVVSIFPTMEPPVPSIS